MEAGWPRTCDVTNEPFLLMKKRHQNTHIDHPAHPNLINYLALIHALTHPDPQSETPRHPRKAQPAFAS